MGQYWTTAAVKTDGTLWAWGDGAWGQLGLGGTAYYSSPVQVGTLTNWKQVSISQYASYGLKTDGTLWSWGGTFYGQMGIGFASGTVYYSSPVQVGNLTNWKSISSGQHSVAAIKTDGTLWAWGDNRYGQLGIGSIGNYYSSPVQIGSLTNWKSVSVGFTNMAAVKTDGTLWVWGNNGYGQIGNSTVGASYYSSPIQVGSLTNWKQVSAGYHTSAITFTDLN